MTGLLVSVRSAEEAVAALQGGAALIDVKEPQRGSLGRADRAVWSAVTAQVCGKAPVSVACGELLERSLAHPDPPVPEDVQFAKCGLAGCADRPDWPDHWLAWRATLPSPTHPVAVIYVDASRAAAPPAAAVLATAADAGCRVVLWDTFVKDGTSLLDHATHNNLDAQVRLARHRGMLVVLAGSLTIRHLPAVMRWRPDYVAVRGAVCLGDRTGSVCSQRVTEFANLLTAHAAKTPCRTVPTAPVDQLGGTTSVA